MSCNVTFLQPQKQAEKTAAAPRRIVTIPKEAIVTRDGKSVVFQIEDKQGPSASGGHGSRSARGGHRHQRAGWDRRRW